MGRMFEYFVVCGLGPEIRTLDGNRGFHGTGITYLPSLLDQYPPAGSPYPLPPPQLPTCVLPGGVEFHSSTNIPRSYPIVLTEGDGSKIYVSCIAFRDAVCDDIIEAYRLPENYVADKCICLVSRSPHFQVLRDALEELFALCFSSTGSSIPLWDYIAHMVSNVILPTPGKQCVLFRVGSGLLFVDAPISHGLPHADISFLPLVQCLDVDNLMKFFIAVLLERRILLRSSKYSLLTLASEAICHLLYPIRWQHVYIPLLFFSGVDYIDAPTPYMMGLHSEVDTSNLAMDGVVVVDLDYNLVTSSEEIPPIPEAELTSLRVDIMKLLCPCVVGIDSLRPVIDNAMDNCAAAHCNPWGKDQDQLLRFIFLKFFASILSGYRNFMEPNASHPFDTQGFLKNRSLLPEAMVAQFLDTYGFLDYLERSVNSDEGNINILHKLQDAIEQGRTPMSIIPDEISDLEIITISDPVTGTSDSKYTYDKFPSNIRTESQEEKRKQILASASGALEAISSPHSVLLSNDPRAETLSPMERAAERERMVLDIKVKLQGLWLRLLKLGVTDDPLSSFEYGTILALIESDAEGIGGSGFVECIREHIHSGWLCQLSEGQFVAVKELLKTAITRATTRDDLTTVRDALEVSSEIYKKDANNVPDYIERHILSLPIWEELRFWEWYFESLHNSYSKETRLLVVASHMAGLGLPDVDAWHILETIARKNIGFEHFAQVRGFLSHIQQQRNDYWGVPFLKPPQVLASPRSQDTGGENPHQAVEASGVGRSWVQSMFSRDTTSRMNSFSRVRRWASDAGNVNASEDVNPVKQKTQTSIRILKGHTGVISALHCVTRREVWDLIGDREDAGFLISGSTDCSIKIWDPSIQGAELKATLKGHSGTVRAINSDRNRIASGSDDCSAIIWDKQTSQVIGKLKGHEGRVSCVKMLSGERVLTAAHDGMVKMWDVRADSFAATIGRCAGAVLCMEYDDSSGILVASGRDSTAMIWDIRSGRQIHKLAGHRKWIRSLRMVEDTVLTGSDDWTARMWSLPHGSCDAVLACHSGSVLAVEYSVIDKGVMTGSADGLVRFWERNESGVRCAKNVTVHTAAILLMIAGDHWLGVGAADNSMSLFHRPQERLGTLLSSESKMNAWQLYRKPHRTAALVRCMVSDLERKRICSGGRDGLLRLWEATINL